jgi:hypothetical protein
MIKKPYRKHFGIGETFCLIRGGQYARSHRIVHTKWNGGSELHRGRRSSMRFFRASSIDSDHGGDAGCLGNPARLEKWRLDGRMLDLWNRPHPRLAWAALRTPPTPISLFASRRASIGFSAEKEVLYFNTLPATTPSFFKTSGSRASGAVINAYCNA